LQRHEPGDASVKLLHAEFQICDLDAHLEYEIEQDFIGEVVESMHKI
jgi:hypothetical protein